MKDDESLSGKTWETTDEGLNVILSKDVKEFVREEFVLLLQVRDGHISWFKFFEERDKLAGKDLI